MRIFIALLLAACLSATSHCTGQVLPLDSLTGRITYTGVVKVEGATADQLYSRATLWYAATFKSGKSAMDLNDRVAGVIVSSPEANFPAYYVRKNGNRLEDGSIKFQLRIECRDGRFKYTLTNLEHADGASCSGGELERTSAVGMCLWNNLWESLKSEADKSAQALIQNLIGAMSNPKGADGGDW